MYKKIKNLLGEILPFILTFLLSFGGNAYAQYDPPAHEDNSNIVGPESTNYKVREADTGINSGGNVSNSENYKLIGSIGQPFAGDLDDTDPSDYPRLRGGQQVYDDTCPVNGTVIDISRLGLSVDVDVVNQNPSNATLYARWDGFFDRESNIEYYQYSIVEGDSKTACDGQNPPGCRTVVDWRDIGLSPTEVSHSGLTLQVKKWYFFRIRAVDTAGILGCPYSQSDGVTPLFIDLQTDKDVVELSPSPLGIPDTKGHKMSIETNSYDGYNLYIFEDKVLTHQVDGTTKINEEFAGTYNIPIAYGANDYGLAINIVEDDAFLPRFQDFVQNKWKPGKYSKVAQASFADSLKLANIVDRSPTGFPPEGDIDHYLVNYTIRVRSTQMAGEYTNNVTYLAVAPLN